MRWADDYTARTKIGDLVLINDERLPPLKWEMGRIIEFFPDNDGVVRVVFVKMPMKLICVGYRRYLRFQSAINAAHDSFFLIGSFYVCWKIFPYFGECKC